MIRLVTAASSPVPGSSTHWLVEQTVKGLRAGLGDEKVRRQHFNLNDLNILPCQACGESPEPDWCFFEDDASPVLEAIARCDCLIVGTPVYFDAVSAQLKLLIDRCNCFRPPDYEGDRSEHRFVQRIHKPRFGGMLLVGGSEGWFEGARRCIAGFFKWIEIENQGAVMYRSPDFNLAGSAANDETTLVEAEQLGRKIAEKLLRS